MQPTLCSRCHKNVAVIFIQKMEGGTTKSEGLCLKCAKEMGIKPVEDMMQKMGISDEDLEGLTNEMMSAFGGAEGMEGLMSAEEADEDEEDEGKTATFPFLNKLFGSAQSPQAQPPEREQPRAERGDKDKKGEKQPKRKFLENYCISLTQKAADGKLDRIIGRDEEIQRTIQILNRRQKNNPCLIGEPGVGKTAIAEGLAQKIYQRDVPYKLLDKEVYLLDLTALVAGTQFRGQFESRMKGLIEEVKKLGNIILVIDEVHNLVGAGVHVVVYVGVVDAFGVAFAAACGVDSQSVAAHFLYLLGALLDVVEGYEVEGDVARTDGEGGHIDRGASAVDGHRGGLCPEVDEHAAQTALILGEHHGGFGQRPGDIAVYVEPQTVGYHTSEDAFYLRRAAEHSGACAEALAEGSHRRGLRFVVNGEAHRHHIHRVAVGIGRCGGAFLQFGYDRFGDFSLHRELHAHIHHGAGERASSESYIDTCNGAWLDCRISLQAFHHGVDGVGHIYVLDAAVAHAVGEFFLFNSDYVDNTRVIDHSDGSPDFGAAYFECHYVAAVVAFSHIVFCVCVGIVRV